MLDPDVGAYYDWGIEDERPVEGTGPPELARTKELVRRYLPPPPAAVFDGGGGTGIHASWLAGDGYQVHLVDPVALHVEQAERRAAA